MIDKPKGVSRPIQEMQQLFVDNLWTDISYSKKVFNQRVFKNEDKHGNVIPEVLIESTNDYKDVRFDDRLSVLGWFDVSDDTNTYEVGQITQNVGVFFAVNLKELYPEFSHRAVDESHLAVQNELLKRPEFEITGISTGKSAYGDFNIDDLKKYNRQPWHVFRFECNVSYTLNC